MERKKMEENLERQDGKTGKTEEEEGGGGGGCRGAEKSEEVCTSGSVTSNLHIFYFILETPGWKNGGGRRRGWRRR
ncbi:MAG: hypothetical protein GY799_09945 [Desulfobulbaceae bacterium]|nr:hypothetical protein [Desulfobulbaceae bacterium]